MFINALTTDGGRRLAWPPLVSGPRALLAFDDHGIVSENFAVFPDTLALYAGLRIVHITQTGCFCCFNGVNSATSIYLTQRRHVLGRNRH